MSDEKVRKIRGALVAAIEALEPGADHAREYGAEPGSQHEADLDAYNQCLVALAALERPDPQASVSHDYAAEAVQR